MSHFPLLALPTELREQIYELVLQVHTRVRFEDRAYDFCDKDSTIDLNLMHINRQLYHEAAGVLLRIHTLIHLVTTYDEDDLSWPLTQDGTNLLQDACEFLDEYHEISDAVSSLPLIRSMQCFRLYAMRVTITHAEYKPGVENLRHRVLQSESHSVWHDVAVAKYGPDGYIIPRNTSVLVELLHSPHIRSTDSQRVAETTLLRDISSHWWGVSDFELSGTLEEETRVRITKGVRELRWQSDQDLLQALRELSQVRKARLNDGEWKECLVSSKELLRFAAWVFRDRWEDLARPWHVKSPTSQKIFDHMFDAYFDGARACLHLSQGKYAKPIACYREDNDFVRFANLTRIFVAHALGIGDINIAEPQLVELNKCNAITCRLRADVAISMNDPYAAERSFVTALQSMSENHYRLPDSEEVVQELFQFRDLSQRMTEHFKDRSPPNVKKISELYSFP